MNYQQARRFSPIPALLAVIATAGTLALAVVLPAQVGGAQDESGVLATTESVVAASPVVNYHIDVVGVREAAATDVHVKETVRKTS